MRRRDFLKVVPAGYAIDRVTAAARPRRLLYTSQGKTGVINADGTGQHFLAFAAPKQVTWQPVAFFRDGRRVLMVSTFEAGLYPFSGDTALADNMANVPLGRGATGEALQDAYEYVWKPRLDDFRPEMVFVSAGFDAHRNDEMASLRWVEDDYRWITRRIAETADHHARGRIVSCLEGGYHLFHLARSVAAHVRELAGA